MAAGRWRSGAAAALVAIALLTFGCAGAAPTSAPPTVAPAAPRGTFTLGAAPTVSAGAQFDVSWTGDPNRGDYVTIVPNGATKVADQPFVDLVAGHNQITLMAPNTPGAYEIWLVEGDTLGDTANSIKARRPITVN